MTAVGRVEARVELSEVVVAALSEGAIALSARKMTDLNIMTTISKR
jgi:phage baseplate assembly protein W